MTQLDYSKPVRLKYPQPGKEDLVYKITSYNEETNRCSIQIQNLNKGDKANLFPEPVSLDDIENIGTKEKKTYKEAIVSVLLAMSVFSVLTISWFVIYIGLGFAGSSKFIGILVLCLYYVVIAVCCYFIVRQNPGSVWYVPIICNGLIFILFAQLNSGWSPWVFWISVSCGFLLVIPVSILGARRGKKDVIINNSEIE